MVESKTARSAVPEELHDPPLVGDSFMGEPLELVHYRKRSVLVPGGKGGVADDVGEPDGGEAPYAIPCHVYKVGRG